MKPGAIPCAEGEPERHAVARADAEAGDLAGRGAPARPAHHWHTRRHEELAIGNRQPTLPAVRAHECLVCHASARPFTSGRRTTASYYVQRVRLATLSAPEDGVGGRLAPARARSGPAPAANLPPPPSSGAESGSKPTPRTQ